MEQINKFQERDDFNNIITKLPLLSLIWFQEKKIELSEILEIEYSPEVLSILILVIDLVKPSEDLRCKFFVILQYIFVYWNKKDFLRKLIKNYCFKKYNDKIDEIINSSKCNPLLKSIIKTNLNTNIDDFEILLNSLRINTSAT